MPRKPNPRPLNNSTRGFFGKVRIARELLKEKAEEILTEYMDTVQKAKDAGDYETAAKSLQWLIEHMPADEEGARMVETGVDKQQQVIQQGSDKPSIMIGIQVGGVSTPKQIADKKALKALSPKVEVIDVEPS